MKDSTVIHTVALCGCSDYDQGRVEEAVARAAALLGGWGRFIRPNMRVLVKANLVMGLSPDRCATTHPSVVAAVCRAVTALGAIPVIADSPGGPFTAPWLSAVYVATGMNRAAEISGALLNRDVSETDVSSPEGRAAQLFPMITAAVRADVIVNVAKLKTHGLTTFSGACKNLFGLIPGLVKVAYHERFPMIWDFAEMLVDIAEAAKPVLSIIDGIVGMEGRGPSHGDPRRFGVLIASASPHAADLLGARIMGLSPEQVPTLRAARRRGLIGDADVVGDASEAYIAADVAIPETPESIRLMERRPILGKMVPLLVRPHPHLLAKRCTGCGVCARSCPQKVIVMRRKRPHIRRRRCIKCLCCEELCPCAAMVSRRSPLLCILR